MMNDDVIDHDGPVANPRALLTRLPLPLPILVNSRIQKHVFFTYKHRSVIYLQMGNNAHSPTQPKQWNSLE